MGGYESPGQGLARGIVAGTEMGLRVRRENLLEEQTKRRNAIEDEELAWKRDDRQRARTIQDEDREYVEGERVVKAVDDEYNQVKASIAAANQQYGGHDRVPPEVAQRITQQFEDVSKRRTAAREKLYRPYVEKEKRKARDNVAGLANGQLDINKLSDTEFAMTILAGTGYNPTDFLRGADGPSKIGAAIDRIRQGLETKDYEAAVEGANVIYEPSLQVGVGGPGPEGTEIVSKRIVQFVPAPNGKGFIPVMSVQVANPFGRQMEKDTYLAPPTHDRSSDPKSRVVSLDMKTEMDRMGRLGIIENLLNQPEARAKIERGLQQLGPRVGTFREAMALSGAPAGKLTTTDTRLGGTVRQTTRNEAGIVTGERDLPVTESPDARARGIRVSGAAAARPDLRVEEVEEEDPDTGETRTVTRYVRIPRAGGVAEPVLDKEGKPVRAPARATAANKPPSENEIKGAEERAKRETARREGVIWDDNARGYVNIKTKRPATPEQIERIEAAAAEAGKAEAAKKPGGKPAAEGKPKVDVAAERARAEAAIKAGKKPELVKALFQERTGQKYD